MPRAAPERSRTCRNPAPALGTIAAEKKSLHLPPQLRHRSVQRFPPRMYDYRPLGVQPVQVQTDGLADPPPDAISRHGIAKLPRRSKPDVRPIRLQLAKAECGEQRARETDALVVDSPEILRSQQTNTFRKTSDGMLPFGAYGEPLAAPCTAARDHRASVLRLHAGAEAVRLGPAPVVRLKSTFRHSSSIS